MNAAHPIFQPILASIAAQPLILARAEYLTALRTMDWQYQFSDDGAKYRRGREKHLRIRELQPVVDPDAELFNAHRPGNDRDASL